MIRESQAKDLECIMQIWLTCNIETHHYVEKEYWLQNYEVVKKAISNGVYVYEEKGELLGFLGYIDSYIAGIFVNKEYRSKGIGKQLLDHAKSKNLSLSLDVFSNNKKAIGFYQREGFQIIHTHINEDTGLAEYRMEWTMTDEEVR